MGLDGSALGTPAEADLVEENEIQFWLYRASVAGWEVHEEPGVVWFASGLPRAHLNGVVRTTLSSAEVDQRIAAIREFFAGRHLPFTWLTGTNRRPTSLAAHLARAGLHLAPDDPGLLLPLDALPAPQPLPPGLEVVRVHGDDDLLRWVQTERRGNGAPPAQEVSRAIHGPASYDEVDAMCQYLGLLGGVPVATVETFRRDGVVGLHALTTVPEARRRGIGTALTLHALHAARATGCTTGVLGATELGMHVYRRLGFRQVCWLGMAHWYP